jgi:hypothetical protein
MAGFNPFAKISAVDLGTAIHTTLDELAAIAVQPQYRQATCGGRFIRTSVKQRTRLNRDRRNRERKYAKYTVQMRSA